MKLRLLFTAILSLLLIASTADMSAQKRKYSGRKHTSSHGGHYSGGRGSSHKGGHYKNRSTNNHYGKHKH